jgi:hypothetical protein
MFIEYGHQECALLSEGGLVFTTISITTALGERNYAVDS